MMIMMLYRSFFLIILIIFIADVTYASINDKIMIDSNTNVNTCSDNNNNNNISLGEYLALQDIYDYANGYEWNWNLSMPTSTQWSFPSELSCPCSWQGITCSILSPGRASITSIYLQDFNLRGELSPMIGNLTSLTYFDVGVNHLEGTIPFSIGELSHLYYLAMGVNNFTGTLPASLGSLANLSHLFLQANSLWGTIPSEFSQLHRLNLIALSYNHFSGTFPSNIESWSNISQIYLYSNRLQGPILDSLVNLTSLNVIDIAYNKFSGSIPREIGNLIYLQQLYLYSNNFTGTVPSEIGLLVYCEVLILYSNYLVGSLPIEIGNLSSMILFYVQANYFTGRIPESVINMPLLDYFAVNNNFFTGNIPNFSCPLGVLDVNFNLLTGQLPASLFRLTSIVELFMSTNYLTSTLPDELSTLPLLTYVYMDNNLFSGTMPKSFGNLTSLIQFIGDVNLFSGSLISEFGWLPRLEVLFLYDNHITGCIPSTFASLTKLSQISLADNYLTGPIPSFMGNLPLETFLIFQNYFSGTVPLTLLNMSSIASFSFANNLLEGGIEGLLVPTVLSITLESNYFSLSLPSTLGKLGVMIDFVVPYNYFSGTIPFSVGNCVSIQSLDLSSNLLWGSIPSSIAETSGLYYLNLSSNSLTGSVSRLVSTDHSFRSLSTMDLSTNKLTGTIPVRLFQLPLLQSVLLYINCFDGSLPSSICLSSTLKTLVLDTLTSAPSCALHIPAWLSPIIAGKFPRHILKGSIPDCIWSMTSLQTLHLSGNGLQGTLGELSSSSGLLDVTLASNNLVGSIPPSFQHYGRFSNLDLSANRLSGVLISNFVLSNSTNSSTKLDLTVNRLSGAIPNAIRYGSDIDVLDSNLFQCQYNNKPISDPSTASYVCGSSNFDTSIIISITTMTVCLAIALRFGSGILEVLRNQGLLSIDLHQGWESQSDFIQLSRQLVWWAGVQILLVLVYWFVVMISFIALKSGSWVSLYATHIHQYSWILTPAYLHGAFPTVLLCSFITFSMVAWTNSVYTIQAPWIRRWLLAELSVPSNSQVSTKSIEVSRTSFFPAKSQSYFSWVQLRVACTVLVHIAVIMVTNVLYVLATLQGYAPATLFLIQFALSCMKLFWNSVLLGWCMRRLSELTSSSRLILSTFVHLFTFLAGPVLATFFTDSSCFRYVITTEPAVDSTFSTTSDQCIVECIAKEACSFYCSLQSTRISRVSVVPVWLYSYQCSSSVLVNYIPVLMYVYAISIVFVATGAIMMKFPALLEKFPSIFSPVILRDVHRMQAPPRSMASETTISSPPDTEIVNELHCEEEAPREPSANTQSIQGSAASISGSLTVSAFHSPSVLSSSIRNMTVMVTFGLACAPLALLVVVDNLLYLSAWNLILSRYVSALGTSNSYAQLEKASFEWRNGLTLSVVISCITCLLFWSIFVFDMIGDLYNADVACICVICAIIGIIVITLGCVIGTNQWAGHVNTEQIEPVHGKHNTPRLTSTTLSELPIGKTELIRTRSDLTNSMNEQFGQL